ncbi:MAG: molybdopterin-binding/glycosyltransferase family 2 protein [Thiolinea sp.]
MKFAYFPVAEALGVQLAHTQRLAGRTLRKGRVLEQADLDALAANAVEQVMGARLEAGELDEDQAAARGAELLANAHILPQVAAHGRCNLQATVDGVLQVDAATIDALNRCDAALTLATLAPFTPVRAGQVVATLKTIPFAVAEQTLTTWQTLIEQSEALPLQLAPFQAHRVALIMSGDGELPDKLFDNTAAVTRARLESLGSELRWVLRCAHTTPAVRTTLAAVRDEGAQLILIAGASVSKDREDTVPSGITAAGGEMVHFGMPVEPGNMLLYARLGAIPVLNLPGCARSRRTNGLDWLLQRLLAGLAVTADDIMGMGVGGLIASGSEHRDASGVAAAPLPARTARIAAIVLAAGRSSRMGERNKLCIEIDGVPMLRRVVDSALASRCVQTLVVSGHEAVAVETVLQDYPVSWVHNAGFAEGMATSLRCGLRALPMDLDAVLILLGDMPRLTAAHLNALLDAFDPVAPAIIVPEYAGRRGNPVLWPRRYFAEMQRLSGDQGARTLLEKYADEVVQVPSIDEAIFWDVDTPQALAQLQGDRT